uniref:Uncharacterized protein n=1 Tax=Electrophorus electricus TaxID=8005 RepID=A0AAY5EQR6_ELEEL
MTEYKDTTTRHLRHKLQSLGRRLDELEEATSKLQKAEDELLELQDKIIQAEGSNSPLLGDVEVLRKRVLKIEGKDEEVRKAEDLCRLVKEKLEEEENLTRELKAEIEHLQRRMTEMENSYDEEQHRALMTEGGAQEPVQTCSGIEIQRMCSPREAFRSKAVIKPAIVEYDRKEVMSGGSTEPVSPNGRSKISTKPNKMTSSITFYPNDPGSSRTSSRSSSVSSEPSSRERHTSTSNIVIGPSTDSRGSISIPYEISIPKSDLTLRPGEGNRDSAEPPRVEATILSRGGLSLQSPETFSDSNDTESGFESTTTTTVTRWRSHSNSHYLSQDDGVPEMRNVTVRNTWRNRGAVSADELGQGLRHDGSEDELDCILTLLSDC